jgi:hypothetical protein
VHEHKLENQAIEIVAQTLVTDTSATFEEKSAMELVGYSMSKLAADRVFEAAGFNKGEGREQVGVVELHDCFAANEVCKLVHTLFNLNLSFISDSSLLMMPWAYANRGKRHPLLTLETTLYVLLALRTIPKLSFFFGSMVVNL